MAKVTSKLQLTVPKAIADQYGIRPGDDVEWVAAGEVIRVIPSARGNSRRGGPRRLGVRERLRLFDQATERQRRREANFPSGGPREGESTDRGWKREDLYTRGSPH